jgi:6,7-dimethyl-8-ribityllumazine synthase
MKSFEGKLDAQGLKFGLVISRFNELLSSRLLEGALDCLRRHKAREEDIEVFWVPGSFEIPLMVKFLALQKKYNALVALGVVIRGDTPHFEFVAAEAIKGIARVSIEEGVPVALGIVTADNLEQAIERAGTKAGNKGWQAALSAIEMANLLSSIK